MLAFLSERDRDRIHHFWTSLGHVTHFLQLTKSPDMAMVSEKSARVSSRNVKY